MNFGYSIINYSITQGYQMFFAFQLLHNIKRNNGESTRTEGDEPSIILWI